MAAKRTPGGLGVRGRALFAGVTAKFELDAYEEELLTQAARCADTMEALACQIDKDGLASRRTLQGPVLAHPLLVELRNQQATYMKLLKSLGLPRGELGAVQRPPAELGKGPKRLRGLQGGA